MSWGGSGAGEVFGGPSAAGRRIVPQGVYCERGTGAWGCPGGYAGPGSIWEREVVAGSGGQGVFCGDFRCPALGGILGEGGPVTSLGMSWVWRRGEEEELRGCSVQREGQTRTWFVF